MRQSYRDKRNRQARINKEKEMKNERRTNSDRREDARRKPYKMDEQGEYRMRRFGEQRRKGERRTEKTVGVSSAHPEEKEYEDIVYGRNAVLELLKSDKDINKIFVEKGEKHGSINEIIARAKENKVIVVEAEKSKLDLMAENNQGVVAVVPPFNYVEVEDILEYAEKKEEDPFIIILDGIEDPHNLGSIIRTAETAGVHGIIIPKRRTATVNSTVVKVSAGATTYMKIARVTNLNDTIQKLKDKGLWIIGTDGSAKTYYYNQDFKGPIAIIVGSEGFGMSKLVKENSDILVKIPMKGEITSLNASVSAGIVIYEAVKQRN